MTAEILSLRPAATAPSRDLIEFGNEFREIAWTLEAVGSGLGEAYARHAHDNDERVQFFKAIKTALGTATTARADLDKLLAELEKET